MPRKPRTPESLAFNRENQRRSRARQRELLDDFQRRVREYERRDVQATLDMQRVARTMAAENIALRGLLASKGVVLEEVETHLQAVRTGCFSTTPVSSTVPSPSCAASPVAIAPAPLLLSQPKPYGPSGIAQGPENVIDGPCSQQPSQACQEQAPVVAACSTKSLQEQESVGDVAPMSFPALAGKSSCCSEPQEQPQTNEASTSGLLNKIHCMEAATILAQIRGHDDTSLARAALGCFVDNDCMIRTTDLLELMDDMTRGI